MGLDGLPNLVIGLREGLEIGLVVSILLAAVRRAGQGRGTGPVWLGVLSAALLSLGFGAVLAFSRAELSITAQAVFGGLLSLVAVALVTWMIFWMRRTARTLSGELKEKIGQAAAVGTGALVATAFLAVAREGLETALFLWTTIQASGDTVAPMIGAAVGLGVSFLLCWLMVRASVRVNLGVFFSRTAVLLIVIAAGVLSYGVGELQTAGLVPGRNWLAFDLSTVVSTDSWWVSLITGVTNLAPRMTVLQVALYLGYLIAVLVVFRRKPAAEAAPVVERPARRLPRWAYAVAAVVIPLLAVGGFALLTPSASGSSTQVTVTADGCAKDWAGATAGTSTITVVNNSGHGGEIYLTRAADGGVIGEIEGLGPGTRRSITVDLPAGQYSWRCLVPGELDQVSPIAAVTGGAGGPAVPAVTPLSDKDLKAPADSFTSYLSNQLALLDTQTGDLAAKIGDPEAARAAWLTAQLTWERLGAAYGQFDDLGVAIDGLPQGLPQGVNDPGFTGLHRVEYGLWHGQSAAELAPVAAKLHDDVRALRDKLKFNPTDLPLRAHEILEDALRRHLNGLTDQGSNTVFSLVGADVEATNAVLDRLAPLLEARKPGLVATARTQLVAITSALGSGNHQVVDARVGAAVETLSAVPTLLEVRAS
ncbi:iron uptake transporter permease EfeU [Kutzneria sp. CA-103260]|uniref:iron uptake transporter permease EfeU n=1 Tax=Kutzneria sp. CA-103260 TaxID=2802641 RepID=UPI001BEF9851|nr:iron uptake transporter permease EfeU [Kutzneria sp. CA-103260]QUQ63810.1 Iron permease FTR1 family protein [Kutzneria sp. CA-103260]